MGKPDWRALQSQFTAALAVRGYHLKRGVNRRD